MGFYKSSLIKVHSYLNEDDPYYYSLYGIKTRLTLFYSQIKSMVSFIAVYNETKAILLSNGTFEASLGKNIYIYKTIRLYFLIYYIRY